MTSGEALRYHFTSFKSVQHQRNLPSRSQLTVTLSQLENKVTMLLSRLLKNKRAQNKEYSRIQRVWKGQDKNVTKSLNDQFTIRMV